MSINNTIENNQNIKQVLFEAKFPTLFLIEKIIGEFQVKVIERFPESDLLLRRNVIFADLGSAFIEKQFNQNDEQNVVKKIWQFKSDIAEVNISINSFDISSTSIKHYEEEGGFKELVSFVYQKFKETINIPLFNRVGLRYISHFQFDPFTNNNIKEKLNLSLPLTRFNANSIRNSVLRTEFDNANDRLIYQEAINIINGKPTVILDIDCYKEKIETQSLVDETDSLFKNLKTQFGKTVKP